MFHSHVMSRYNDTNESFMIPVKQIMIDGDNILLTMAGGHFDNDIKANRSTDFARIKLQQINENYALGITTFTHKILYYLKQLQIALNETTTKHTNKLKCNYCNKILKSLVFIERIHIINILCTI